MQKFEELYEEAAGTMDELAERLLITGGKPVSTLKEYLQFATIEETSEVLTAEEMVQNVVNDFSQLISELKEGKNAAEQADDEVTSDMFTELIEKLSKHNWMLTSFSTRIKNRTRPAALSYFLFYKLHINIC